MRISDWSSDVCSSDLLSRQARRRMAVLALAAILAGTLLFSGGLVVAHFTGAAARTAPFGGPLLIVAWLAWAVDALRKSPHAPLPARPTHVRSLRAPGPALSHDRHGG